MQRYTEKSYKIFSLLVIVFNQLSPKIFLPQNPVSFSETVLFFTYFYLCK